MEFREKNIFEGTVGPQSSREMSPVKKKKCVEIFFSKKKKNHNFSTPSL